MHRVCVKTTGGSTIRLRMGDRGDMRIMPPMMERTKDSPDPDPAFQDPRSRSHRGAPAWAY